MQRAATTLVGLAAVMTAVWLVAHSFHPPKAIGHDPSQHATTSAGPADAGAVVDDAGAAPMAEPIVPMAEPIEDTRSFDLDASVPRLPASAPSQVHLGIILVSFATAQPSAAGGHLPKRSKTEAKALADRLRVIAQEDFHAAVLQGDSGSSDEIGRVERGILEPAPEYVVFTLPKGQIGGPIETPRGYWIVKRLK
ncbi:MAG: peptidylprolyl isomerase [Polyangiaceae bacterium]